MNQNISAGGAPTYYRAVFLSDFHMGAKSFDARALTDFLKSFKCDKLYLVGDIIDGWKLNKRWYWTEDCSRVLDELLKKSAEGTRIIYLPGNHDEEIRRILPVLKHRFAKKIGIEIKERTLHTMLDGRKFLVLHGDQFDRKILKGPLSRWFDKNYDNLLEFFGAYRRGPKIKIEGKMKPFSLAKSLSKHSQKALQLLNNFETAIYAATKSRGLDGLICGHTHIPVIKPIRDILYANSGSWLREGHTALVETHDGTLELIDCPSSFNPPLLIPSLLHPSAQLIPSAAQYRPTTHNILHTIRRIWPEKKPKSGFTEIMTQTPRRNFTRLSHIKTHLPNISQTAAPTQTSFCAKALTVFSIHDPAFLSMSLQSGKSSVHSSVQILAKPL